MPTVTKRTDIHSPVNMDPENYEYIFAADLRGPWALGLNSTESGQELLRELANLDPATAHRGYSQCHHCGAHIRYVAWLKHLPTGYTICVGETCLDNRFALESKADFDRLRKAAELDRQKMRVKTAAGLFMEKLDGDIHIALSRETDLVATFGLEAGSYAERTITDIRSKLWDKYGDISDKTVAFVGRLLTEHKDRAAEQAKRAAERAAETRVAAPEGRLAIEGTVVSRKVKDGDWGSYVKLVIVCGPIDARWAAYVTEPSAIECKRGDVVRMTVTLKRSDRDESFAFGKSPKKAEVVGHKADAEMALDSLDALDESEGW